VHQGWLITKIKNLNAVLLFNLLPQEKSHILGASIVFYKEVIRRIW